MKKVIASAGLLAVGAAGLNAAYAPGLTRTQTSKPWSISASVRGFYDDNYNTQPSDRKEDSFGLEITPLIAVNFPKDQTYLGASYRYSMKWYEARDNNSVDQSHIATLKADHRFSEKYDIWLDDRFIYSQEPDLVEGGTPIRTDADGFRNSVKLGFNAGINERVGVGAGYANNWIDFDDEGAGSRSAQLDRLEHLFNIDGRYNVREDLTALLGYQFGLLEYTADELLYSAFGATEMSDIRDNYSHYVYAGAEGQLNPNLTVSGRAGIQYTDFDNLGEDAVNPYLNGAVTYSYAPGSYVQAGVTWRRQATDVTGATDPTGQGRNTVTDQNAVTLYGEVNHRMTAKLTGNGIVQGQVAEFNGGVADGEQDRFLVAGAYLDYEINKFLNAELGYNYDRLDSDLSNRSFTRNRVYLGLRGTY